RARCSPRRPRGDQAHAHRPSLPRSVSRGVRCRARSRRARDCRRIRRGILMLLQIAEPGESQIKEACKKRVVGIDIGPTNSLVATVVDGTPRVIEGPGGALVPSVVHYAADGAVTVGRPAEARAL